MNNEYRPTICIDPVLVPHTDHNTTALPQQGEVHRSHSKHKITTASPVRVKGVMLHLVGHSFSAQAAAEECRCLRSDEEFLRIDLHTPIGSIGDR